MKNTIKFLLNIMLAFTLLIGNYFSVSGTNNLHATEEVATEVENVETTENAEEELSEISGISPRIVIDLTTAPEFADNNLRQDIINIVTAQGLNPTALDTVSVKVLDLHQRSYNLHNLAGLELFTNLEYLNLSNNPDVGTAGPTIGSITHEMPKLKTFLAAHTSIVSSQLDFSENDDLEKLDLSFLYNDAPFKSGLTEIDLTNNTKLQYLDLRQNSLADGKIKGINGLTELRYLDLSQNASKVSPGSAGIGDTTAAAIANFTKLKILYLGQTEIKNLNLSAIPDLEQLNVDQTQVGAGDDGLDVTNNPKLWYISAYRAQIKELDLSQNPDLQFLVLSENYIRELDLSHNPNIGKTRTNQSTDPHYNSDIAQDPVDGLFAVNNNHLTQLEIDHLQYLTNGGSPLQGKEHAMLTRQTWHEYTYWDADLGCWIVKVSNVVDNDNLQYVTNPRDENLSTNVTYNPATGVAIMHNFNNPNVPPVTLHYDYMAPFYAGNDKKMDVELSLRALTASKTVVDAGNDGYADQNEVVSFVITTKNLNAMSFQNVLIQDKLTDYINIIDMTNATTDNTAVRLFTDGVQQYTFTLQELIDGWTLPNFPANSTVEVKFSVTMLGDPDYIPDGNDLINTAKVDEMEPSASIKTGIANLVGTKSVADNNSNGIAEAGERLYYTIEYENTGDKPAHNVKIIDPLDDEEFEGAIISNVKVDNVAYTPITDLTTGGLNIGTIAPGQKVVITFEVTLPAPLKPGDGKLKNQATTNTGEETPEVEIPTDAAPALTGQKNIVLQTGGTNNSIAEAGETLTYEIEFTNTGNLDASNVIITDPFDDTEFVDAAFTITGVQKGILPSLSTIAYTGDLRTTGLHTGVLKPGETVRVTVTVKLKSPMLPNGDGTLYNQATGEIPNGPTVDVDETIPTDAAPALSGQKNIVLQTGGTNNSIAEAGETLTYEIEFTNTGNLDASKVIITDPFADAEFDGATITVTGVQKGTLPTLSSSTYTGDLRTTGLDTGVLKPGETVRATVTVKLKSPMLPNGDGFLYNKATGEIPSGPKVDVDETIPTDAAPALAGKKEIVAQTGSDSSKAEDGETLTYEIEFENTGNLVANNVEIKDPFDDAEFENGIITVISILRAGTPISPSGNLKNGYIIDTLQPGEKVVIRVTVQLANPLPAGDGRLKNIATGEIPGETPINVDKTIPTEAAPELAGSKRIVSESGTQPNVAEAGETIVYEIEFTNIGNLDAENVEIKDPFDDTEFGDATITVTSIQLGTTGNMNTITPSGDLENGYIITKIQPGEKVVIRVTVTLKTGKLPNGDGELINIATGEIPGETPIEVDKTIPTDAAPEIVGKKELVDQDGADDAHAEVGETLTYTIEFENIGNLEADKVIIKDPLSDTEFAGATETLAKVEKVAIDGSITNITSTVTGTSLVSGYDVGKLGAGEKVILTFTVKLDTKTVTLNDGTTVTQLPNGDGTLYNKATGEIFGETPVDTNPVEIPTTAKPIVEGNKAIIAEDGVIGGTAEVGETITYSIVYTNKGNIAIDNVIISDPLLDEEFWHLSNISISDLQVNGTPHIPAEDILVGIPIATIAAGSSVTITFKVTLPAVSVTLPDGTIITQLPDGDGRLKNTATAELEDGTDVPTNEVDIPTNAAPRLEGEKAITNESGATDGLAEVGERITYKIVYTNTGNIVANNVIITDLLNDTEFDAATIENLQVNGVDNAGSIQAGINVGNIAPGQSVEITFDVILTTLSTTLPDGTVITQLPTGDGWLKNQATGQIGSETPVDTNPVEIPTDATPILHGKKTVTDNNNDVAEPGEVISYRIEYTNSGNIKSGNVVIKDELLDTEFWDTLGNITIGNLQVDGAPYTPADDILTGINVGSIEPGDTVVITFEVTLPAITVTLPDGSTTTQLPDGNGKLYNIAMAQEDSKPEVPIDEAELPTNAAAVLTGAKVITAESGSVPNVAEPGETLSYKIIYTNNGSLAAENVTIYDLLDDDEFENAHISNLKVDGATHTPISDLADGIYVGTIAAGASVEITFDVTLAGITVTLPDGSTVTQLPNGDGLLENTAVATRPDEEDVEAEEEIDTTAAPRLTGTKKYTAESGSIANTAEPSETITYEIEYKNTGDLVAKNVIIQDLLNDDEFANLTISNLTVTGGTGTPSGTVQSGILVGDIEPGGTVTIRFDVTLDEITVTLTDGSTVTQLPNGDGYLDNIAGATIDGGTNIPTNPVRIPTTAETRLEGTKSGLDANGDGIATAGETISYTITYRNSGDLPADNVVIYDPMSDAEFIDPVLNRANITNLEVDGVPYSPATDLLTLPPGIAVGTIAAGSSVTITFDVILPAITVTLPDGSTEQQLPSGDGKLRNQAFAKEGTEPEIPTNPVEIPTDAQPILVGVKTGQNADGSTSVAVGDTVSYTIEYENIGNADASNVVITDLLDDTEFNTASIINLKVNGVAHTGDLQLGINVGTISSIAPNNKVTITFDVVLASIETELADGTIIYQLPQGDGWLVNQATAVIDDDTSNPIETEEVEIPTDAAPIIEGEKVGTDNDNNIVEAGDTVSYTITYKNIGNIESPVVHIIDPLGDTEFWDIGVITLSNMTVNGTAYPTPNDILTAPGINVGTIAVGAEVTITFDVTMPNPLPVGDGKLENIATATLPDGTEIETEETIPTDAAPELVGTKVGLDAGGDGIANGGEIVSYTISYTNIGNLDAENVIVHDPLNDAEFAGSTISNLEIDGIAYSGNAEDIITGIPVGTIAPNQTVFITFDVALANPLPAGDGLLKNIATATFPDGPETETPEEVIPTDAAPEIIGTKVAVDADGDGIAGGGETITYTISYTNIGNLNAENVIIHDPLDDAEFAGSTISELKIDGLPYTLGPAADIITGINVGTIAPNQTVVITFDITLVNPLPISDGELENIATATLPDGTEIDTEETVPTDAAPEIIGTKVAVDAGGDGIANGGELITYTISYTNIGNLDAENVVINDPLDDAEFVGSTISNLEIDGVPYTLGLAEDIIAGINVGTIAPNQTVIITFDITLANPLPADDGNLENIATATLPDGTEVDTEETVPTDAAPELVGTKVAVDAGGDGIANGGETITYTITYTNIGNLDAEDVYINDPLNDTEFVGSIISNLKIDGITYAGNAEDIITGVPVGTIAANQTVTITFDITLANPLPTGDGELKNIATATLPDGTETETPEEVIPTDAAPVLIGTKSVVDADGDNYVVDGETITYTITYTNIGNLDADNVTITDPLDDIEFIGSTISNLQINGIDYIGSPDDIKTGIPVGMIAVGATVTITFDITLPTPLPIDDGILKNIAVATLPDGTETETPEVEIPVGHTGLETEKTVTDATGDGLVQPEETLTYIIEVTNIGTVTDYNTLIQDDLALLLPYIETPDNNALSVSIDGSVIPTYTLVSELMAGIYVDIPAGATVTIEFDVVVKEGAHVIEITSLKNIAFILSGITNEEFYPETEIPKMEEEGILEIEKAVSDANNNGYAEAGEVLTYTITVNNIGSGDKNDVVLKDELTELLPYIENPLANPVTVTIGGVDTLYTVADLIAGITVTIPADTVLSATFDVQLLPTVTITAITTLKNTAYIDDDSAVVEIPVGEPTIVSEKRVTDANENGYAIAGESLTYEIFAQNIGNVDATDVWVQDELTELLPYIENPEAETVYININGVETTTDVASLMTGFTVSIPAGKEMLITFTVKTINTLDCNEIALLTNTAIVGETEPTAEIPTENIVTLPVTGEHTFEMLLFGFLMFLFSAMFFSKRKKATW